MIWLEGRQQGMKIVEVNPRASIQEHTYTSDNKIWEMIINLANK